MKKLSLLYLFTFISALTVLGQWNTSSYPDIYYNLGRVAINTTTFPNTPHIKLTVEGSQIIYGPGASLYFGGATNTIAGYGKYAIEYHEDWEGLNFWRPFGSKVVNNILFLGDNGNVGIGTKDLTPDYKLTVAGKIHAREVLITETAGGADFVFRSEYKLPTLAALEEFITQNKHLPGIKSAKQMEEQGINIAEFQILLLQKIEELTLYIIEQQKEIDNLKNPDRF